MAKLSAHGAEIARYLVNGTLRSARSDGTVLQMSVHDRTWKLRARKKADVTIETWTERKLAYVAGLPACRPGAAP